jgi:8-amino-7-oxononanoate synthase
MDGDVAPLAELSAACDAHGAWLVTDDAHGFGVVHLDNPAPIQLGTLSKSAGAYGGYVAGPAALVDFLASRARSFVYATGLPPPVLAAALAALEVMDADPGLAERARANAALFCRELRLPKPVAAIVPVIIGEADAAMAASAKLEEQGFLVPTIRPPTVPAGTARLRVTFSAVHDEADILRLAAAVKAVLS